MKLAATAASFLALLSALPLGAQSHRSLTDSKNDILLAQGATITVPTDDQGGSDDPEAVQEKILLLRSTIKSLTESLAISNSEAEAFKRQSLDLSAKLEALGIPSVEKDQGKLEQRLLAAVRDLRLLKKQHEDAVNELVRLTEAVQVLLKRVDVDPQTRMTVETELRKTGEVLGTPAVAKPNSVEATLNDGMVIDIKEDLSLIVANIGEKQGVQTGMPFQVWREDKRIGYVRVIDVRERISGAIIQSLESEKVPIKTGDRLKVDAKQ